MKRFLTLFFGLALACAMLAVSVSAQEIINDGKTILIEAEEFDEVEAEGDLPNAETMSATAMVYDPETDSWDFYEGGNIANTWRTGSAAFYEVNIPKAGTYKISFRVSTTDNSTASVHLDLSTNGTDYTNLADSKEFTDTASMNPDSGTPFHNYIDVDALQEVALPEGKVTFKMTFVNHPNVDYFTLTLADGSSLFTPAPTAAPTPEPTATPEITATPEPAATLEPAATQEPAAEATAIPTIEPDATEAPEEKSGCGSLLSLGILAALMPAAFAIRKKQ